MGKFRKAIDLKHVGANNKLCKRGECSLKNYMMYADLTDDVDFQLNLLLKTNKSL